MKVSISLDISERKRLRLRLFTNSEITLSGCRLWLGFCENNGYGRFYFCNIRDLAHRWAYRAYHGEIPEGLDVLHTCDVPNCIAEKHIYAGTHTQNMQDKVNRGRCGNGGPSSDESHHFAKLTNSQARSIRISSQSDKRLAIIYEVSPTTIRRIKKGVTYADA